MLPLEVSTPLTVADIDEWLTLVRSGGLTSVWCPYPAMREQLGTLLGKEFPHRTYPKSEMASILAQARLALAEHPRGDS